MLRSVKKVVDAAVGVRCGNTRRLALRSYSSYCVIGEIKDWTHRAIRCSAPQHLFDREITARIEAIVSKPAIGGKNLSHSCQMPVRSAKAQSVKILVSLSTCLGRWLQHDVTHLKHSQCHAGLITGTY